MQTVNILTFITSELTVQTDDGPVKYGDFCGHYCQSNVVVNYFYLALDRRTKDEEARADSTIHLTYPIAKLYGLDIHLERSFYGVRLRGPGEESDNITDIAHVELIVMSFLGELDNEADERKQAAWEIAVQQFALARDEADPLEVSVIGVEIVDLEMNRDSQKMAPYFATGSCTSFTEGCRLHGHAHLRGLHDLPLGLVLRCHGQKHLPGGPGGLHCTGARRHDHPRPVLSRQHEN